MRNLRRLWKRLASWTRTRQDEERLAAEIEDHLARQTEENIREGLSPGEARRQAVLKFGAVESVREDYRNAKGLPFIEALLQDTRYALRRLRNAPVFTVTTVLTLALGIGATTRIFTLVYAVLLKSLAVANPDELYRLGKEARCCYWGGYTQNKEFSLVSYDLYKHLQDNTKGFSELAAFQAAEPQLGIRRAGSSEPAQSYPGEFVSGNYFSMFGVGAYAGRALTAKDDQPNAPPVAVMSYRLWQQKYGSDPSVIGSVFDIDGKPFTVVGITPPAFFGDTLRNSPPDFFLPLNSEPYMESDGDLNKANTHWLDLIGRIRPQASPAVIEAQMQVELKQWLRSHWGEMSPTERAAFPQQTLFLRPGGAGISSMREEYEHWLQILMMVSGFVLLIVCANVANLMLVRGMERRRQISVSMALGARAPRLIQQALTESIALSLLGGITGLGIAIAGTRLVLHFAFPTVGGMAGIPISASPSMPVLLFAFVISLLTGIGFGVGPAWMATRVDPIEALRGGNRATARMGSIPRKALVIFQAALSLVLLSASGLLMTTLQRLQNQDFGFDQERRVVVNMNPRLAGYQPDQLTPLYQRITDSLSSMPEISAVALCTYSPLAPNAWGAGVSVDGQPTRPNDNNFAGWNRVTAGYFSAIGTTVLEGRGITDQDTATSRHVAVINEAFARKYFKNENPIGKHFGRTGPESRRQYEIVGIVQDARYLFFNLDKPISPFFFLPEAQHDIGPKDSKEISAGSHFLSDILLVTKPGADLPFARIQKAMASVDPNLPVTSVHTLTEQVTGQFRQQRLLARLTSFFGMLSLVLSCIGLYGVTAYGATSRANEIGVRMALGARRGQVVTMILRGAFALLGIGLCIGLPLALAMGRFLGHQLYGLNPYDPVVMSVAVGALAFSALAAAFVPAWRASFVSPLEALRAE